MYKNKNSIMPTEYIVYDDAPMEIYGGKGKSFFLVVGPLRFYPPYTNGFFLVL